MSQWPPQVGSYVKIGWKKDVYIGQVHSIIWDSTAAIIILHNNLGHHDSSLVGLVPEHLDGSGLFLLTPKLEWLPISDIEMIKIRDTQLSAVDEAIDKNIVIVNGINDKPRMTPYSAPSIPIALYETYHLKKISYMSQTTFDSEIAAMLDTKVRRFDKITRSDIFIVRRDIDSLEVEKEAALDIIQRLRIVLLLGHARYLEVNPFSNLRFVHHLGYLDVVREGEPYEMLINVPSLKNLSSKNGEPIDFDDLWKLSNEIELKDEIRKVLQTSCFIAIQPTPDYAIWCLKRLIMIWFSDPQMYRGIYRLKIAVNVHNTLPTIVICTNRASNQYIVQRLQYLLSPYENMGIGSAIGFTTVNRLISTIDGWELMKQVDKIVAQGPYLRALGL